MPGSVVGLAPSGQDQTNRQVVGLAPSGAGPGRQVVGLAGTAQPKPSSGGGGFLGAISGAAHWVGQKADLAARDIKSIPAGVVQGTEAAAHDMAMKNPGPTWSELIKHPIGAWTTHANGSHLAPLIGATIKQTRTSVEHPLRDPFQTALTVIPAVNAAGKAAEVGEAAARAGSLADNLDALKAARTLKSGEGEVALSPHSGAAARQVQRGYAAAVNKAMRDNPTGKLAAHGQRRIGGALNEEAQIQQRINAVPARMLDRAASKMSKRPGLAKGLGTGGTKLTAGAKSPVALARNREEQAALELASVNTTPEDAAAYHEAQAAKGVNPAQNTAVAKLYRRVGKRGLLAQDEAGNVVVNAADHPKLAAADAQLQRVQQLGDQTLAEKGVRPGEALATRRNAPAQIRAGAVYEKPTPGKVGTPSVALLKARAKVATLEAQHADATEKALANPRSAANAADNLVHYAAPAEQSPTVARISGALSVAKDDLARLEQQAQARVKPTGIVGGEGANPGRGFVSYRPSEKKLSKAEASAPRGSVVGAAKAPIDTKTFTGRSIEQGLVPKDVTGAASRHFRQIQKFVNTDAMRRRALQFGSDTRRSDRDVLVRNPDETPEQISSRIQQALGREHSNVDTADELATQEGLGAAHEAFLHGLVPGLKNKFVGERGITPGTSAEDAAAALNLPSPKGYKWVDQGALGNLTKAPVGPRGKVARAADTVNSAVTAATVYFKVGHLGTRYFTNAATNIIQGSAKPGEIGKSIKLWNDLSDEDKQRALAASGQHGFAALPHEGDNVVSRVAGKGAQWWARRADSIFRFNSLAYEMRNAGIKTPDEFRNALDALQSGGQGLPAHQWAKVSAAARKADRDAISYDRLNDLERRYITRAFWFYPWVKGATTFGARTVYEHPYKAAALGAAGAQGYKTQQADLGALPSYESGLFKVGGNSVEPDVADFSTFSPFATPADIVESVARPKTLGQQLNPVYSMVEPLAFGVNDYGEPTTSPLGDAISQLFAPTPEAQILSGYQARNQDQSRRMFPKSKELKGTLSPLLRALAGPGMPRKINLSAAHSAASREKSGR